MTDVLISTPAGVLAVLAAVTSFFFWLARRTQWPLFNYLPPLIFIYVIPVVLSNTGIIPSKSPVYDFMGDIVLPMFLIIMLVDVDLRATVRVMGRGVFVMLAGTVGVMIGAPLALLLVKHGLGPETWKGFGALSGSWIGGTGNMLAVAYAIGLDESSLDFGYAVIADNAVYLIWLPIMLGSKNFAKAFNKFTRMPADRMEQLDRAAAEVSLDKGKPEMRHFLYILFFGFAGAAMGSWLAGYIPEYPPILTTSTYKILLVTVFGILLSFTGARKVPSTHAVAMALVYLFVARMGAKADLSNLNASVMWFLLGAYIWIFIHGAAVVAAARLFRVDVHTAAIASAANIGAAASAPIVAAHHRPALVPVSILLALLGYAIGTPAGVITAWICRLVY